MRILIVAPGDPRLPARIRTRNIGTALTRLGHDVTVLYPGQSDAADDLAFQVTTCRADPLLGTLRAGLALARGRSMRAAYVSSRRMWAAVSRLSLTADLVIFKRKRTAHLASAVPAAVPCIVDLTDSVSLWQSRVASLEELPWRMRIQNGLDLPGTVREETRIVRSSRFAQVWISSPVDLELLEFLTGTGLPHARVIPNVVGSSWLAAELQGHHSPHYLAFHADFRQPTNRDAAGWLLNDLWPKAAPLVPDVGLQLAGHGSRELAVPAAVNGQVERLGFLPNVEKFVASSLASIAPLRAGAGTKNKIMESLAVGRRSVASTLSVEGLPQEAVSEGCLVFSEEAQFRTAVQRVVVDAMDSVSGGRDLKISSELRKMTEELLSTDVLERRLHDSLTYALRIPRARGAASAVLTGPA